MLQDVKGEDRLEPAILEGPRKLANIPEHIGLETLLPI